MRYLIRSEAQGCSHLRKRIGIQFDILVRSPHTLASFQPTGGQKQVCEDSRPTDPGMQTKAVKDVSEVVILTNAIALNSIAKKVIPERFFDILLYMTLQYICSSYACQKYLCSSCKQSETHFGVISSQTRERAFSQRETASLSFIHHFQRM